MRLLSGRVLVAMALALASGCKAKTTATPAECDRLDRQECTRSTSCTLLAEKEGVPGNVYRCVPTTDPCGQGFSQDMFTNAPGSAFSYDDALKNMAACSARSGCIYDPGNCYCGCHGYGQTTLPDKAGPQCNCACGGGPPQRCRTRTAADPPRL